VPHSLVNGGLGEVYRVRDRINETERLCTYLPSTTGATRTGLEHLFAGMGEVRGGFGDSGRDDPDYAGIRGLSVVTNAAQDRLCFHLID
jgi:hypothetical protein